jgi:hypothetical protein
MPDWRFSVYMAGTEAYVRVRITQPEFRLSQTQQITANITTWENIGFPALFRVLPSLQPVIPFAAPVN